MIRATFDDTKLQAKIRKAQGQIKGIVQHYAGEVVDKAQETLAPIYEDRREWPVSGRLRGDIDIEFSENGTMAVIFNEVPYARLRHYENKAHPTTVGYFSKAMFKIRRPMKEDIRSLLRALDN